MPRQLSLPAAPRFDSTGLHAEDCGCARCEQGFKPTSADRWAARQAQIRMKAVEARGEEATKAESKSGLPMFGESFPQ